MPVYNLFGFFVEADNFNSIAGLCSDKKDAVRLTHLLEGATGGLSTRIAELEIIAPEDHKDFTFIFVRYSKDKYVITALPLSKEEKAAKFHPIGEMVYDHLRSGSTWISSTKRFITVDEIDAFTLEDVALAEIERRVEDFGLEKAKVITQLERGGKND